ncbi:MAG TPA: VOC family protein [Gaiellaceae bacterium]|nr:VOC family protein [Gaiellaceae bacterium]
MELAGVLETVVYCTTENEEETRRFYREVLGLEPVRERSVAHRLGAGVFLLFNADESSVQESPPAHGAPNARTHTCFVAAAGDYEEWKERLAARDVPITQEIEWPSGPKSFYFEDPAGNVLEIAEADMWPR